MKTVGIICEYNPFHKGHEKQIRRIRDQFGPDTLVVCLMSGNFVQRGAPAVFDKSLRARAAVACGADVVLEMPVTVSLSSAEGFAAGSVAILSRFCDVLCFGSESADTQTLFDTAQALLSPQFSQALRQHLDRGISFPAARCAALVQMGIEDAVLRSPNDILAVEYCKAILAQGSTMTCFPVFRDGDYHAVDPDAQNPSASSLRCCMQNGKPWLDFVPQQAAEVFRDAPVHTLEAGATGMLARFRTMSEQEFETVPYGSEGLWRKLMHACRRCATIEEIAVTVKSKRYTRSRIDRMMLCAFLGLRQNDMGKIPPYIRVLAVSGLGMELLRRHRKEQILIHIGEQTRDAWWELEQRTDDLYGLFCTQGSEPAGMTRQRRIYVKRPD